MAAAHPRSLATVTCVLLVVLAGCGGAFGPVLKPLPDRPDRLTEESVLEYVKTYERRYVRNQIATERDGVRAIDVAYRTAVVRNRTDGGFVIHLQYTLRVRTGDGTTDRERTANYLVNESVTMRAVVAGFVSPGPDPREGVVMAREN